MSDSSFCPRDRILSGATTPGQSGPGSNGNEKVLCPPLQHYWSLAIRLFSVISRTLVWGGDYPSAEMQSVYSTVPADWAVSLCGLFNAKVILVEEQQ